MELLENTKGNYLFLTGIAPYSSGVAAIPGFEIVHVTLRTPLVYHRGFGFIDDHLSGLGRSRHALCAIELRSPKPFTFEGFGNFNAAYQELLVERDLLINGSNPIARTNVAPELSPSVEPMLSGFSFTVPAEENVPSSFVIAGAGDLRDQVLDPTAIVRRGQTSADALREKAAYVMAEMARRLEGLHAKWDQVTSVDIYTIHPLHLFLQSVILDVIGGTAVTQGINWLYSRPPILGLEFEMDVRGTSRELRAG